MEKIQKPTEKLVELLRILIKLKKIELIALKIQYYLDKSYSGIKK
jgi:hypothetical protein